MCRLLLVRSDKGALQSFPPCYFRLSLVLSDQKVAQKPFMPCYVQAVASPIRQRGHAIFPTLLFQAVASPIRPKGATETFPALLCSGCCYSHQTKGALCPFPPCYFPAIASSITHHTKGGLITFPTFHVQAASSPVTLKGVPQS
jgi:hypothetical protein